MQPSPESKENMAKVIRYHLLGIPQKQIARRLKLSISWVNDIITDYKPGKPVVRQQVLYHATKLVGMIMKNKREVLADLLGFPIDDWPKSKVEAEFIRLIEEKKEEKEG